MEENLETKSVYSIGRSENRMENDDKEHKFEDQVNFDRENKPRTAAFPSKIWVFSKELDDSPHSSS
jgi:hypothetical protein